MAENGFQKHRQKHRGGAISPQSGDIAKLRQLRQLTPSTLPRFGREEFWTRSFRGEERRGDERILVLEERRMEEERRIEERRGEGSLEGRGECRR